MTSSIVPVIMSGGSGTRLWPLSTPTKPKQFHRFTSEHTLFQDSLLRFPKGQFAAPIVIAGLGHISHIIEQSNAIGYAPMAVLLEPMGRNTACVAALASICVKAMAADSLVLLAPADHVIAKPDAFLRAINEAKAAAKTHIITFGITPSRPETGYGYIEQGTAYDDHVSHISQFLEKPDLTTAQAYVDGGRHLWNAGIFLFAPEVMLNELERLAPDVLSATQKAFDKAEIEQGVHRLNAQEFARAPSISIDYAIMEKTNIACVKPCDIGWYDLGSFLELYNLAEHDANGNVFLSQGDSAKIVSVDSLNCLVRSESLPIGVIGLRDIMVIATDQGVVVAPLARAQDIKRITEGLA